MPEKRTSTASRDLAASSRVATASVLAVAWCATLGIVSHNLALTGISLCIGAGGLIGWLLAGSPALNRRTRR